MTTRSVRPSLPMPRWSALSACSESAETESQEDALPANPAEWLASLGAQSDGDDS